MKRFAFALLALLVLAPTSFARSIDRTPVVAKLDIVRYGFHLREATLLEDGRLLVLVGRRLPIVRVLSPRAMFELRSMAVQLSDVETKTETRDVVCMTIMPMNSETLHIGQYDSDANSFVFMGETRTILTPQDCTRRTLTYPANPYFEEAAKELKAALLFLVMDAAQI